MRWPKYWSFSFRIIPSKEIPGLISFRKDWLDLLAVQGTLKSLLQHYSSKASILWHSAVFTFQLSHPYVTTGKSIGLTRRTLVDKVMSLLLNMLSRLVIEQSFGLCGRGRGWDDLGEWHWNMSNIIYEMNRQSSFDAWYWMLGAGALGWPRGMVQGGRREGDSGWGTRVYLWQIHVDVWQNQYNIVK